MFNALDLMDNKTVLEDLKFGMGDGNLHYYLYNYKCPELQPEQVSSHTASCSWGGGEGGGVRSRQLQDDYAYSPVISPLF